MATSPPLIAVVEDEDSVRKALARLLRSVGWDTHAYASGEEFLQALSGRMPDCILLDLNLAGLNGLAVQAQLRKSGVILPVIFISAEESPEARRQALRAGAVGWLPKPVQAQFLLDTIALALRRTQLQ